MGMFKHRAGRGEARRPRVDTWLQRYLGERLHGERPLGDQLVPAGERGQHREEVVPQVPADVDVEVALYPRHYQSLHGEKQTEVEPQT